MRKSTIIGVLGAGILALTGCSPDIQASDQPPAPGTPPPPSAIAPAENHHNGDETAQVNTDMQFAEQMISFARAESELVEIALNNADNEQVVSVAESIEQRDRGTERIQQWLTAHGNPNVTPGDEGTGQDSQFPNVEVSSEIPRLREAQQSEFARLWVDSMLDHLEGMREVVNVEINKGTDQELKSIAEQVRGNVDADLEQLRRLEQQL